MPSYLRPSSTAVKALAQSVADIGAAIRRQMSIVV